MTKFCYIDKTKTCPKVFAGNTHSHTLVHMHKYIHIYCKWENAMWNTGGSRLLPPVSVYNQARFFLFLFFFFFLGDVQYLTSYKENTPVVSKNVIRVIFKEYNFVL